MLLVALDCVALQRLPQLNKIERQFSVALKRTFVIKQAEAVNQACRNDLKIQPREKSKRLYTLCILSLLSLYLLSLAFSIQVPKTLTDSGALLVNVFVKFSEGDV